MTSERTPQATEPAIPGDKATPFPNEAWTDDDWAERGPAIAEHLIAPDADVLIRLRKLRDARDKALGHATSFDRGITRIEKQWSLEPSTSTRGRLELVADMQVAEPDPPHFTFIADKGATILYGKGGSGKGSYAAWIALRAVRELGWKVLLIDSELRDYEWKPRLLALGATDIEQQAIAYYKPTSAPIWEQVANIQAALSEIAFTPDLIALDSVARACAEDISTGNTSLAVRYFAALDQLCSRHLSIAHVGHGDKSRPLGSGRWEDDARLTWRFEEKGDDRLLSVHKTNLGGLSFPKRLIRATGWSETAIPLPTGFEETLYHQKLPDLIHDLLTHPMDYDQITEAVNEDIDSDDARHTRDAVKKAIGRGTKTGLFTNAGDARRPLWARASSLEPKNSKIDILFTCSACSEQLSPDEAVIRDAKRYHATCANEESAA